MADDQTSLERARQRLPGWPGTESEVAGAVDYLSIDKGIFGWVIDIAQPEEALAVELVCGDETVATGITSLPRPDITASLAVQGNPGFGIAWETLDYEQLGFLTEAAPTAPVEIVVTCRNAYLTKYPGYQLLQDLDVSRVLSYVKTRREALAALEASAASAEIVFDGFIDFYGFSAPAGGWFFCGWVAPDSGVTEQHAQAAATFESGEIAGTPTLSFFYRPDLGSLGTGLVIFVPGSGRVLGNLHTVNVRVPGARLHLPATSRAAEYRDNELAGHVRATLTNTEGPSRDALMTLLSRRSYTGQDSLSELGDPVFIEFDEAVFCPPDGIALLGWMIAKPGAVKSLWLHSGVSAVEIDMAKMVPVERQDVVDAVGQKYGLTELRNGFVAFASGYSAKDKSYLAVETQAGEVGYKPLPIPKLVGLPAMKRVLSVFDTRYVEVGPAFENVVGPAVEALNRDRLAHRPRVDVLEFGSINPQPRFSVIVPLYGRMDFFEYQMALFSLHAPTRAFELIYVLDDPANRRDLELLAESVWERFNIPFRLLLLERNMGFAPANNIGLSHAHGDFICFLNSDVFPGTRDWLERLAARLEENPDIGCVGPLLLYEDQTIQHCGMEYAPLKMFAEWKFPLHTRKGWRLADSDHGLERVTAITGAAMVMRGALARQFGGFDEIFAIGDFEDSDLCFKISEAGLKSAVDRDTWLYHLERKSQTGPEQRWRLNLTLYNAWQHQRRWQARLAQL